MDVDQAQAAALSAPVRVNGMVCHAWMVALAGARDSGSGGGAGVEMGAGCATDGPVTSEAEHPRMKPSGTRKSASREAAVHRVAEIVERAARGDWLKAGERNGTVSTEASAGAPAALGCGRSQENAEGT